MSVATWSVKIIRNAYCSIQKPLMKFVGVTNGNMSPRFSKWGICAFCPQKFWKKTCSIALLLEQHELHVVKSTIHLTINGFYITLHKGLALLYKLNGVIYKCMFKKFTFKFYTDHRYFIFSLIHIYFTSVYTFLCLYFKYY